jgi:UDP-glucuronate 4-epimerase
LIGIGLNIKILKIPTKKILITGVAGFIGYHLAENLLQHAITIIGLDSLNSYYNVELKWARLNQLGISRSRFSHHQKLIEYSSHNRNLWFYKIDLEDDSSLDKLFTLHKFDAVCNLAAQAGVRYSIENPKIYIESNVKGFLNILECCRQQKIKRLVYASSSSVYRNSKQTPFNESSNVDYPVSLYAATKKANELMAHTYSHLYDIETIGLRFFTVYGPWGRPEMALFLFTKSILNDKPIKVFNNGKLLQ